MGVLNASWDEKESKKELESPREKVRKKKENWKDKMRYERDRSASTVLK